MFTTAHWRGYQGYWLLKDEHLYLTSLKSSNLTIKDIFNTEEPVLADWYTGILEFGIGEYHCDHWWGYFDEYVWLKFENGKVINKKIKKNFNTDYPITFWQIQRKEV